MIDYEERAIKCFEGLEFVPYKPETFSRKKREYVEQFQQIAGEVTDVKQFLALMLKSHELFLNLVEVNIVLFSLQLRIITNQQCHKSCTFFQDKLETLDSIQRNQLNWDKDLRDNLNKQTETSQTLNTVLTEQLSLNNVRDKMVQNLEGIVTDLHKTLGTVQETRTEEANITASCKTIVHSFSLRDPFFW